MTEGKKFLPLPRDARVIEFEGITYPSVTTVLSAIYPIVFPEYKLRQYASRGSIVDAQIKYFLRTGRWETNLLKIPQSEEEMLKMCTHIKIVTQGNLHLRWQDCNFRGFMEKYGQDFKPWKGEFKEEVCFNKQHRYVGSPDWACLYRDEPAIADFKACANYPQHKILKFKKQMSAYARCDGNEEVKQVVVIPLNPTNKCGFSRPIVEGEVDTYFKYFLKDRQLFKQIYGI